MRIFRSLAWRFMAFSLTGKLVAVGVALCLLGWLEAQLGGSGEGLWGAGLFVLAIAATWVAIRHVYGQAGRQR